MLRDVPMACHQGSFECRRRTPCTCKIDDGGRNLSRDFAVSDVVVLLTPVQFGGDSSETS